MIDIGTTNFYIAVPSLPKWELEKYSMHLFDLWERNIEQNLLIPDYSLALQIEEGSIKGTGKIAAWLMALYFGIGNYGSFISGLQTIGEQASAVGDFLAETAEEQLAYRSSTAKVRKRSGTLGSLQRLFVKVQQGGMTPEQAMKEAEVLLGAEAQTSPEFMHSLNRSLADAPLFHKQVPLPLEGDGDVPQQPIEKNRGPRRPYDPVWPPSNQFRIEVWRESKKEKKNIRIVTL
jgi:hypothetical protein